MVYKTRNPERQTTIDVICGAGTDYPYLGSPLVLVEFVFPDLYFSVLCFVDHCLFSFVWSLYCLSFDLRLLITNLVS